MKIKVFILIMLLAIGGSVFALDATKPTNQSLIGTWPALLRETRQAVNDNAVPVATTTQTGKVKPDGSTILVDQDGTIHSTGGGVGADTFGAYTSAGGGRVTQDELSTGAVKPVATIAALRTYSDQSGSVHLSGYYAANDGGGGIFVWDAASTATDNGGTIIKPTAVSGAGRWLRQYSGPLRPEMFGGFADSNRTPGSGTDSTSAIQTILDSHQRGWLSPGAYRVTAELVYTSGSKLSGSGGTPGVGTPEGASIIYYDAPGGTNSAVVRISANAVGVDSEDTASPSDAATRDIQNIELSNIVIDGGGTAEIGVYMVRAWLQNKLDNIAVTKTTKHGFLALRCWGGSPRDWRAFRNQGAGITLGKDVFGWDEASVYLGIEAVDQSVATNFFAYLNGTLSGSPLNDFDEVADTEKEYGIGVFNSRGLVLVNAQANENGGAGIFVAPKYNSAVTFVGGYAELNGTSSGATSRWDLWYQSLDASGWFVEFDGMHLGQTPSIRLTGTAPSRNEAAITFKRMPFLGTVNADWSAYRVIDSDRNAIFSASAPLFNTYYSGDNLITKILGVQVSSESSTLKHIQGGVCIDSNTSCTEPPAGSLDVAGNVLFGSGSGVVARTLDGGDTSFISLGGGGALSATRGAYVKAHGNEATATGKLELVSGNVTGSTVTISPKGTVQATVDGTGMTLAGTLTTSGGTLGTAAFKDIPATGDATTGQVVYGTDSRLTLASSALQPGGSGSQLTGVVKTAHQTVKNALELGILNNGSDQGSSIQALWDMASPGDTFYFPRGTYGTTVKLNLPDGKAIRIIGDGEGSDTGEMPTGTTFKALSAMTAVVFKGYTTGVVYGGEISNIAVDCNTVADVGIEIKAGKRYKLDRIRVIDFKTKGVAVGDSTSGGSSRMFYEGQISNLSIALQAYKWPTPSLRADYGLHLLMTASDNTINNVVVANVKTAGFFDEALGNSYNQIHPYSYPEAYNMLYGLRSYYGGIRINQMESDGVPIGVKIDYGASGVGDVTVANTTFGKRSDFATTVTAMEMPAGLTNIRVDGAVLQDGVTPYNISGGGSPGAGFRFNDEVLPETYGAGWSGNMNTPTKDDVYDKIETIVAGSGSVDNTAYGVGWDTDTTHAPSKNAVYDKIQSMGSATPAGTVTGAVQLRNSGGTALSADDGVVVGGSHHLEVTGTTAYQVAAVRTSTSATNFPTSLMKVKFQTTQQMTDNFGAAINFNVQDADAVDNTVGLLGAVRSGQDNTGAFIFRPTYYGSTQSDAMRIFGTGEVSIAHDSSLGMLGVTRPYPLYVYAYNGSTYQGYTTDAKTAEGTPIPFPAGTTQYLYISGPPPSTTRPFPAIDVRVGTPASGLTLTAEYWNGSAWTAFSGLSDGTSNLTQDGVISWTMPTNWASTTVNSLGNYWARIGTSSTPSVAPAIKSALLSASDLLHVRAFPGDTTPAFAVNKNGSATFAYAVDITGALSATTLNGNTITTGTGTLTLGSYTLTAGATGTVATVGGTLANTVLDDTKGDGDTGYVWSADKVFDRLALKITANAGITGATKTKVTYDASGLVTAGADAALSDIGESTQTGTGNLVRAGSPTIATPAITAAEVNGSASASLTAAQVSSTIVYNTGMGAADVALTLPTAAAGYSALFTVGTAQSNKWGVRAGASDKIYLIGDDGTVTAGSDNGYARMTAAQVGQSFACWTFKTDSYDWMCRSVSVGTSTFAAN